MTDFRVQTSVARPYQLMYEFAQGHKGDMITTDHKLIVEASILDVAMQVGVVFDKAGHKPILKSDEIQYIAVMSENVMAFVHKKGEDGPSGYDGETADAGVLAKHIQEIEIILIANVGDTRFLSNEIKKRFHKEKYAAIKWWYEARGSAQSRVIYIDDPKTELRPEFYPDLGDPEKFIEDYLKSSASVLLMSGEPGTGKTTLLRSMIYNRNLRAAVIYDEKLMSQDYIFQDFLFGDQDLLVIEDADKILSSRDEGSNPLMSRFLSVSDGLIKLPNKKMVFTTNIIDFHGIDEALLRPGRCYGLVQTRKLDLNESIAACKAAGLLPPIEKRTYSLAELFNRGQGAEVRRMGFAA